MNIEAPTPTTAELLSSAMDLEWARLHDMLSLAEAMRTGAALDNDFANRFAALSASVSETRAAGSWQRLSAMISGDVLEQLTPQDLDLMALALAPVARPAFAPRIQSLQPQLGTPWPGLAFVQELLMLETSVEIAALIARLTPTSPLVASGLLKIEGTTPSQTLRPGPVLIRIMLDRDPELSPPPGASLSTLRGTWDQLVLPAPTLRQLREFGAWVEHRHAMTRDWGARAVHGPLALFSGASGTGKSFAATVLATELGERTGEPWALYSLDLGRIMSKYVGETEKNLNALLDSLEGRNAILQIDEADGLLGKRGEVSDARDRYANLEVSHMLARFERHSGPVILTTNLRANVDPAFLRRFQLVVDFPTPDDVARAALWKVLLPPKAPLAKRVELETLGAAVRLSGGSIANAATYAAVLAYADDGTIDLPHIARAIWAELTKDTRQVRPSEIGYLAEFLEATQ
ncbi:ATPase family protein associated with various cellular activities (AAA) [Litoreibacter halocynthiae]|uniref:ATPase family protein associated with various cellular activities (AAA) n=1 Tax=Litoreibacter halocynthiae TaxID=1242689 RepID=A0A4R7LQ37_9RHOB|nr:ATP-binding protein [Litoreibacter halocynthiae]TDT77924.1 ATPase family protein associated with various cellular activities (AAA) [Litoreibacter halocynthiae]